MQPCRTVLQAAAANKLDLLEGVDEQKGHFLLFEAFHRFILKSFQFSEPGKDQATDVHSSESGHIIYEELLQFGGTGWKLLFMHL